MESNGSFFSCLLANLCDFLNTLCHKRYRTDFWIHDLLKNNLGKSTLKMNPSLNQWITSDH